MNEEEYHKFLTKYLKSVLHLETDVQSNEENSSSNDPTSILDLSWEDDSDNDFSLKITNRFFGSSPKTHSSYFNVLEKDEKESGSSLKITESKTKIPELETKIRESKVKIPKSKIQTMKIENIKKVNKVTELVQVPTTKHVAQILGKKGKKILALRETTNTYIRSPLPQEEPVFIIKGEKEDVAEAVKSIKSASDYFTAIETEKKLLKREAMKASEGRVIVVKFSIPECYVGLVLGVKGCTIKEIEKQTKTFIQSPVVTSEPVFIISGSSENCEKAMHFISRYMSLRGIGPGTVECVSEKPNYFFAWNLVKQAEI